MRFGWIRRGIGIPILAVGVTVLGLAAPPPAVAVPAFTQPDCSAPGALPDCSVSPNPASPGQRIIIAGSGWLPNNTVQIRVPEGFFDPGAFVNNVSTDASGLFTTSVVVLSTAPLGSILIDLDGTPAIGSPGSRDNQLLFTVAAAKAVKDKKEEIPVVVRQLGNARLPDNAKSVSDLQSREREVNKLFAQCDSTLGGNQLRIRLVELRRNENPRTSKGIEIAPKGVVMDKDVKTLLIPYSNRTTPSGRVSLFVATTKSTISPGQGLQGGGNFILVKEQAGLLIPPVFGKVVGDTQSGTARVWAHELIHALGLDHSPDAKNLMYAFITVDNARIGKLAGSALTATQCRDMESGFKAGLFKRAT